MENTCTFHPKSHKETILNITNYGHELWRVYMTECGRGEGRVYMTLCGEGRVYMTLCGEWPVYMTLCVESISYHIIYDTVC